MTGRGPGSGSRVRVQGQGLGSRVRVQDPGSRDRQGPGIDRVQGPGSGFRVQGQMPENVEILSFKSKLAIYLIF
eukprot:4485683-Pleurochrysis_carterae.AAC.1